MMRKPGGYAILSDHNGLQEADTFTCGHCQHVVHVHARQLPEDTGGLCKVCMKLTCKPCTAKGVCTPWEVMFERMEARNRFLSSAGL